MGKTNIIVKNVVPQYANMVNKNIIAKNQADQFKQLFTGDISVKEKIVFISHDHDDADFAELLKLQLEKNGIKEIYSYGSPEERKSLIQKFGKEMFIGVPLLGTELTRKDRLEQLFNKEEDKSKK